MTFNSWTFLAFCIIVYGLYYRLPHRGQNWLILIGSYVFYGAWDWRFLGLLWVSTAVDFAVGKAIEATDEQTRRKRLLWISLGTNLGILGFFKYFNFFADSLVGAMAAFGVEVDAVTLEIVLPVGISFYTFQTLAYSIDVYRGRMKAVRDPLDFAIYVAFFPQLVAGPIERAQNLMPQISQPRTVTAEQLYSGAQLVLIGLFRKIMIADIAADRANQAFANAADMTTIPLLLGVLMFALQIYGDFSGYSSIARGLSRMLGVELMENFRHPYFSTNITVFWRRWHISLSSWLRDYLYISLGGNRGPQWFVYRNLMLTMLLGGLWHGASWNFVVWGGIHGLALALHKLWLRGEKPPAKASFATVGDASKAVMGWLVTMLVVGFAWVFFRAQTFEQSAAVLSGIAAFDLSDLSLSFFKQPLYLIACVLFIDIPQHRTGDQNAMLKWHWAIRGIVYTGMILYMVAFHSEQEVPFIYFQF
ncbi:MAG: MBOAT family O-acyltransferase [Bradymonadia bacterium]